MSPGCAKRRRPGDHFLYKFCGWAQGLDRGRVVVYSTLELLAFIVLVAGRTQNVVVSEALRGAFLLPFLSPV